MNISTKNPISCAILCFVKTSQWSAEALGGCVFFINLDISVENFYSTLSRFHTAFRNTSMQGV